MKKWCCETHLLGHCIYISVSGVVESSLSESKSKSESSLSESESSLSESESESSSPYGN